MFCMCICFCGCRQYMVAIPAVVEAGAQTRFCVSLLQPSETLVMTVTLISQEKRTVLFEKTTSTEFHTCVQFQVSFSHSWFHVVNKNSPSNIWNLNTFPGFKPFIFSPDVGYMKNSLMLLFTCDLPKISKNEFKSIQWSWCFILVS